jgi:hypothetical protein
MLGSSGVGDRKGSGFVGHGLVWCHSGSSTVNWCAAMSFRRAWAIQRAPLITVEGTEAEGQAGLEMPGVQAADLNSLLGL